MKLFTILTLIFCISINVTAQVDKAELKNIIATHQTLAIVPVFVTLDLRKGEKQRTTEEKVLQTEQDMSFMMQTYTGRYFEEKKEKYDYTVSFQKRITTNKIIFKNDLSYDQYLNLPADSLARLTGADAILIGRARVSKLMDDDLSQFLTVLRMGVFPGNCRIGMDFELIDTKTGKIIWTHKYLPEDNTSRTIEGSLAIILRKVSKVLPYRK